MLRLLLLALLVLPAPGHAADLPSRPYLDLEAAQKILDEAVAELKRQKAPGGTVAIVDGGGYLVVLKRQDNTHVASPMIAYGKARTAAMHGQETSVYEQVIRDGRTAMLGLEDFVPMQGGVPIRVGGHVVGACGISGAASAPQDEAVCRHAIQTVLGGR